MFTNEYWVADDYETINIAYIVRGILNKNMIKGTGRD